MITVNVDPCLGVDENTDMLSRMNIYPNPNDGLFTFNLDMPGTADFVLTVTDILGKNIYSKSQERITGMYSENIDLKGVDAGIYFATIQIEGKTYVKKVVIE